MSITIYGKPFCPYCQLAVMFCKMNMIPYEYKELDEDFTKEELLTLNPNAKTFPQIFENGRLIGGYVELVKEKGKNYRV